MRRRLALVLNPPGIIVSAFIGAVVLACGGSWPIAVALGLGLVPGLTALLGVLIWVVGRLEARSNRKRWEQFRRGRGR